MERDIETQEWILKGNKLYKKTMRLVAIGKSLLADTDEAPHNDYVMLEQRGDEDENNNPPDDIK